MKGLLIKDLKLFQLQGKFFMCFVIAIGMTLTFINHDATFLLAFLTFLMSNFSLSTISYDEFDNGYAFLFTLPITRKQYVMEKYLFTILLGGGACLFSIIFALIYNQWSTSMPSLDLVLVGLMILSIVFIYQSLILPCVFKFGGEKGRIAILIVFGLITIIGFVLVKGIQMLGFDIGYILNHLSMINMGMVILIMFIVALLFLFISMQISIVIMNKKEF